MMNVEQFRAPDLPSAFALVRDRFGPEAVILGTRTIEPKGIRRFFEKSQVEVFASPPPPKPPAPPPPKAPDLARSLLEEMGASPVVAQELSRQVPDGLETAPSVLEDAVRQAVEGYLDGRIASVDGPRSVALVGPTGAGKTTTLAKLAARFALDQGLRVGLVTTDTYRIGAVNHLQTYAEIMGVPWQVAEDPASVRQAVAALAYCDRILIDTSGRNFRREENRQELEAFLEAAVPDAVVLVVPLTTGRQEMEELAQHFFGRSPSMLVLTKLDEAVGKGKVLDALEVFGLPLAALTNGQTVPDDIWFPEARALARALGKEGEFRAP